MSRAAKGSDRPWRSAGAGACAWVIVAPGMQGGCTVVNSFGSLAPQRDRGAIVVGGVLEGDSEQFILTALDPLSGQELPRAQRRMTVAGVAYDGDRPNLWYVFESGTAGHFFPSPGDAYYVHVMQLEPFDGTWTELAALSIPPAVSFSTTTVLSGAIAYVAYSGGQASPSKIVVLDTTDPAATHESDELSIPSTIPPTVAVVGARSTSGTQYVVLCATRPPRAVTGGATDGGHAGGGGGSDGSTAASNGGDGAGEENPAADMDGGDDGGQDDGSDSDGDDGSSDAAGAAQDAGSRPAGGATPRSATLTEFSLSGGKLSGNPVGTQGVSPIGFGLVGFAGVTTRESTKPLVLVVANPGTQTATLSLYDPFSGLSSVGTGQFAFNDPNAQPPAFSRCDNYAFAIGTNADTAITAIDVNPLVGAPADVLTLTATPERTGNSGQGLYFEPYTGTVLAPFVVGANINFNAFYFARASDGTVQLNQRQGDWHPPPTLRPNFVVTKVPTDFVCRGAAP